MAINVSSLLKRLTRGALTENLGLKAVAAFFAVLFYFLVMFQEEAERNFDVEIIWDLPGKDSGMVLSSRLPDELRVRLRGPSSTIDSIKPGSIRARKIDLSKNGEGTTHYYFSDEDFEIPTRTKFMRVTPESALVKLEQLITRQVPVRVRTYGKLGPGTEFVDEPTASPGVVSVTGPVSNLRNLRDIETEDIDIDNLAPGEHPYVVPARRIDGVTIQRGDGFRINLRVRWIPGKRVISNLRLTARGTELSAKFTPGRVAIDLTGPQVVLDKLEPKKIVPIVRVPEEYQTRPSVFTEEITLEGLPDNVIAASITPKKVQVKLINKAKKTQVSR